MSSLFAASSPWWVWSVFPHQRRSPGASTRIGHTWTGPSHLLKTPGWNWGWPAAELYPSPSWTKACGQPTSRRQQSESAGGAAAPASPSTKRRSHWKRNENMHPSWITLWQQYPSWGGNGLERTSVGGTQIWGKLSNILPEDADTSSRNRHQKTSSCFLSLTHWPGSSSQLGLDQTNGGLPRPPLETETELSSSGSGGLRSRLGTRLGTRLSWAY